MVTSKLQESELLHHQPCLRLVSLFSALLLEHPRGLVTTRSAEFCWLSSCWSGNSDCTAGSSWCWPWPTAVVCFRPWNTSAVASSQLQSLLGWCSRSSMDGGKVLAWCTVSLCVVPAHTPTSSWKSVPACRRSTACLAGLICLMYRAPCSKGSRADSDECLQTRASGSGTAKPDPCRRKSGSRWSDPSSPLRRSGAWQACCPWTHCRPSQSWARPCLLSTLTSPTCRFMSAATSALQ